MIEQSIAEVLVSRLVSGYDLVKVYVVLDEECDQHFGLNPLIDSPLNVHPRLHSGWGLRSYSTNNNL